MCRHGLKRWSSWKAMNRSSKSSIQLNAEAEPSSLLPLPKLYCLPNFRRNAARSRGGTRICPASADARRIAYGRSEGSTRLPKTRLIREILVESCRGEKFPTRTGWALKIIADNCRACHHNSRSLIGPDRANFRSPGTSRSAMESDENNMVPKSKSLAKVFLKKEWP